MKRSFLQRVPMPVLAVAALCASAATYAVHRLATLAFEEIEIRDPELMAMLRERHAPPESVAASAWN